MDVVGSADPYFVAKLDDKLSYVQVPKSQSHHVPGTETVSDRPFRLIHSHQYGTKYGG